MIAVLSRPGALARFSAALVRSVAQLRTRARNRKALTRLASLDDRMLRDIGISRLDVASAWEQSRHRDPIAILRDRAARR